MNVEEEARSRFNSGYNCAESVLIVVSKHADTKFESPQSCIPRIATGFGGGIARNGDGCGALVGGAMALSLKLGRDNSSDSRDACYAAVDRFYREFTAAFGSCRCRDLTGVDLKNPEQRRIYEIEIHERRCNPIVAWAAKRAYETVVGI